MSFMTTPERLARTEELVAGIELGLDLKFGATGLVLMKEISAIRDVELLRAIREAIKTTSSPDELRRVWTPKRRARKPRGS